MDVREVERIIAKGKDATQEELNAANATMAIDIGLNITKAVIKGPAEMLKAAIDLTATAFGACAEGLVPESNMDIFALEVIDAFIAVVNRKLANLQAYGLLLNEKYKPISFTVEGLRKDLATAQQALTDAEKSIDTLTTALSNTKE